MKVKEIVIKKDTDLEVQLKDLKNKLTKTRFEIATKESNKMHEIGKIKLTIARIETILRERQLQREEEKNEKKA